MYFRVSKYTNIDTRYTMISCIVYKALLTTVVSFAFNLILPIGKTSRLTNSHVYLYY